VHPAETPDVLQLEVVVEVGVAAVADFCWLCKASNPTIAVVSSFFSVCWHVRNPKITDKAKMVLI
jgi:hypothetical protein